ncbi:hypothetical protein Tco_0390331 [Tanacetum coccineum]
MTSNLENVRSNVLMKLQEALDEEAILEEQILTLMHHFADRFTDRRVEINNLMVLQDHPLIDYAKYALGCMTGADMKKCVHLKSVRDELLRTATFSDESASGGGGKGRDDVGSGDDRWWGVGGDGVSFVSGGCDVVVDGSYEVVVVDDMIVFVVVVDDMAVMRMAVMLLVFVCVREMG